MPPKLRAPRHAGDAARLDALTGQVTQARTALNAYDELDALCREQKQAQDAAQLAGALAAKRRTQLEALDAALRGRHALPCWWMPPLGSWLCRIRLRS